MVQQGAVDWFTFWLKGEEDPDPNKALQYARWRELRKLQQNSNHLSSTISKMSIFVPSDLQRRDTRQGSLSRVLPQPGETMSECSNDGLSHPTRSPPSS
jgi:hypothetical protein